MKIVSRIRRLEHAAGINAPACPGCGDIDFESGSGMFAAGFVLPVDDGRAFCFCKLCSRSFEAVVIRREDGLYDVRDAKLSAGPF